MRNRKIRGSLVQNLYLESIVLTSATFASAMANLAPGVTFVLGVFFRLENLSIKTLPGKAKIFGTLIGIGGAMVLTFYKGIEIKTFSVHTHILKSHAHETSHNARETLLGSFTAIIGCCSYALWLIIQAKLSTRYPCYYSCSALLNLMAAIQSVVFALIVERDFSQWKLGWNIRLLAASFTGVVASGVMITLVAWCIRLRGPLFISIFNPLLVVIVALIGCTFLNEKLYIGSVIGGVFIVLGLYAVVWGKGKEIKKMTALVPGPEVIPSTTDEIEIVTSLISGEEEDRNKCKAVAPNAGETV